MGKNVGSAYFPSFEEGSLRPSNKMSRYLKQGAAAEVRMQRGD